MAQISRPLAGAAAHLTGYKTVLQTGGFHTTQNSDIYEIHGHLQGALLKVCMR